MFVDCNNNKIYVNTLQLYSFISLELKMIEISFKWGMFSRILSNVGQHHEEGAIIRMNMVYFRLVCAL